MHLKKWRSERATQYKQKCRAGYHLDYELVNVGSYLDGNPTRIIPRYVKDQERGS